MPRPGESARRIKAVLWTPAGVDENNRKTFNDPIELTVRWLDRVMDELNQPNTNEVKFDATVEVDRLITKGSLMWKGALDDLPTGTAGIEDLMRVDDYTSVPSLKGDWDYRTVSLMRYGARSINTVT